MCKSLKYIIGHNKIIIHYSELLGGFYDMLAFLKGNGLCKYEKENSSSAMSTNNVPYLLCPRRLWQVELRRADPNDRAEIDTQMFFLHS